MASYIVVTPDVREEGIVEGILEQHNVSIYTFYYKVTPGTGAVEKAALALLCCEHHFNDVSSCAVVTTDGDAITITVRGCKVCRNVYRTYLASRHVENVYRHTVVIRYVDPEIHLHPGQQAYLQCSYCNPFDFETWLYDE